MRLILFISTILLLNSCVVTKINTTNSSSNNEKIKNVLVVYQQADKITKYTEVSTALIQSTFTKKGISSELVLLPDYKTELSLMSPNEIKEERDMLINNKIEANQIDYILFMKPVTELIYSKHMDLVLSCDFDVELFKIGEENSFWDATLNVYANFGLKFGARSSVDKLFKKFEEADLL